MIDIHHHLLPGLDDGSPDMETSIKMVEMAARDGITHIVCTPHANNRFTYSREKNQLLLDTLKARIDGKVTLGLGCDFHMSYDNIQDALDNVGRYSINGRNYVLVEFADAHISETSGDSLYELALAKQKPIITHPERNPILQRHPDKLAAWVRDGALVQVTASSFEGRFGRTAQAMAEKMVRQNWVHFLATDAHNLESRAPVLSKGYEYLKKHFGVETADRLCVTNPRAVFDGAPWPEQPAPTGLEADLPGTVVLPFGRGKTGFFRRFFGMS